MTSLIRWGWLLLPLLAACGGGTGPQSPSDAGPRAPMTAQQTVVDPDVNGPAGQVYRLYRAAFARTPDLEGLGFHIATLQAGHGLEGVSSGFLASREFQERYGALDNVAFVTQLYANVLGREPDAGGLAYHVGNLDTGLLQRQQVLIGFSESRENKENTAEETAGGIVYIPYQAVLNAETSYANYKAIGLVPQSLPYGFVNSGRGFGDFSGQGGKDIFVSQLRYQPWRPIGEALPGLFEFWAALPGGGFEKRSDLITAGEGCIHPRKALVADFNRDGRPDVFVVCHGYDAHPFPGERNKIVLSQPGGRYVIADASTDVGFFHGGAAADFDGDGDVDVFLVGESNGQRGNLMLNTGNGSFVRDTSGLRVPASLAGKNYFTAEVVDVDADGLPDLLLGGHEWEGAVTSVYINPGNFNFASVQPAVFPAVAAEGVVLDFTITGSGDSRTVYVLRTSGGDGTFYQSLVLQRVRWPSLQSDVVVNQRPKPWVPWLIPAVVGGQNVLTTDNSMDAISIAY